MEKVSDGARNVHQDERRGFGLDVFYWQTESHSEGGKDFLGNMVWHAKLTPPPAFLQPSDVAEIKKRDQIMGK